MTSDDLAFSISQYLDGSLSEADAAALEEILATRPEARAIFEAEQKLTALLRSAPMPAVDFDAFARRVSDAVAREPEPFQSYRIASFAWRRTIAIAASILIAVGLGALALRMNSSNPNDSTKIAVIPPKVEPIAIVALESRSESPAPNVTVTSGAPVIEIAVGPSKEIANQPAFARYADDMVRRPSRVIIASSATGAQDTPMPY